MDSSGFMALTGVVVGSCIIIAIILAIREIVCWYGKQNEIVKILKSIETELKKQNGTTQIKNSTKPIEIQRGLY